ncbi:WXG100 family type VII secretion target [Nocardia rosealba]|uniref:WXG100 family type VII secretion target n=1 Tax=Nocardia rosealba TaxID=2878563 RepID=UPI001CD97516|nr:WXG100 family type VII secretion target [Nocardia rosealba]MCA2209185.1 WXG100 family type VII secretion target [Nocardia rosealba]
MAEALRTALTSANTEVDSLLSSGWKGDLATQFGTGWTETHDGGATIIAALTTMAEKLGITAENYQQQDTDHAYTLNMSSLDLPAV